MNAGRGGATRGEGRGRARRARVIVSGTFALFALFVGWVFYSLRRRDAVRRVGVKGVVRR